MIPRGAHTSEGAVPAPSKAAVRWTLPHGYACHGSYLKYATPRHVNGLTQARRLGFPVETARRYQALLQNGNFAMSKRFSLLLILLTSSLALSGCLKRAVVATTAVAGAAAGAAVSATSTAAAGISSGASAATGGLFGGSGGAENALAVQGGAEATSSQAPTAPPEQTITEGADACLKSAQYNTAILENLGSQGWQLSNNAVADAEGKPRTTTVSKPGVRGTVLPDGSCTFQAEDVAYTRLGAEVHENLVADFQGQFRRGSPDGRTGECDGYTIDTPDLRAWLYFTAVNGGSCTSARSGSSLTVRLLQ